MGTLGRGPRGRHIGMALPRWKCTRVVVVKAVSHGFSEEVMCELRLTGAWGCVAEGELSFTAERGCL